MGVSAVTAKAEVYSAEIELLKGMKQCLEKRRKYRSQHLNRLRYREKRFDNRKAYKPKGWLAPSIEHKLTSQIRSNKLLAKVLPIPPNQKQDLEGVFCDNFLDKGENHLLCLKRLF